MSYWSDWHYASMIHDLQTEIVGEKMVEMSNKFELFQKTEAEWIKEIRVGERALLAKSTTFKTVLEISDQQTLKDDISNMNLTCSICCGALTLVIAAILGLRCRNRQGNSDNKDEHNDLP